MNRNVTLAVAAHLVEYPQARPADQARAAAAWLDGPAPEAAALARRFAQEIDGMSLGASQEAYIAAFDFATTGTLYAGEHLFGPTEARASFLARLRVLQRDHGLDGGAELPDHVAELLRLAAAMPDGDERDELLRDAVLPTARAALDELERAQHLYAPAIAAVIAVVEQVVPGPFAEPARLAARVDPEPDDLLEPSPEVAR